MSLDLVFLVIDAFSVLAFTLIGIQYLYLLPKNSNAHLVGLLCLGVVCHVVLGRYQYGYWIGEEYQLVLSPIAESLMNAMRNATPGLFLFLSHSILRDGKSLPKVLVVVFIIQLLLEEPVHLILDEGMPYERLVTEVVPTLLQSILLGSAVYWIVVEWLSDLIEARRRIRVLFLLFAGVDMLLAGLLLRIVVPVNEIENYYVHVLLVSIQTLLACALLVRALSSEAALFLQYPQATDETVRSETYVDLSVTANTSRLMESERTMAALNRLINDEHVYRNYKISIRSLADELRIPEYRLRKLIHEQLGFRNFNSFLHHYRINEACEMLSDSNQVRTPILTIALTVGYQSISTFNRAFREVVGGTPSAYRAKSLEELERTVTDS